MELFTIGHSNHSADKFLKLVKDAGITMLVDVRSKPNSRFPHFKRDNLIQMVRANGVDYRWGGQVLGGLAHYGVEHGMFKAKMDAVLALGVDHKVALLCSEGKPCECHRAGKLTAYMLREKPTFACTHILPDGALVDAMTYETSTKFKDYVIPPEYLPTWPGKVGP